MRSSNIKYMVRLSGSNFLLKPGLKEYADDQLFGFYATRIVDADNAEDAEGAAASQVRRELDDLKMPSGAAPQTIRVEWSKLVSSASDARSGFTWYPQTND
jgi:hypothetical protein